ncbi:SUMF1/EgtB/PvdO family nonheme iron enzyme [Leptolyngbya sp. FACHB-671]|nr:SUMF1/EgtB/PvdO family nonheme iron enzyme [Leptolyngbya sp. FACHB-671]
MPVILRSCAWDYTPLAAIQAYPEKAKPIVSWPYIDDAYTDVVRSVHIAATKIKERRDQRRVQQERTQREQQRQAEEQERLRQAEQLRQKQAAEAEWQKQQAWEQQRQAQLEEAESKQRPTEIFEFEVVTITKGGLFKKPEVNRTRKRAKCYIEDLGNNIFLDMVAVPGNSFHMGSTEYYKEQPVHKVQVAPFFIGRYSITQAQWRAVAGLPKVMIDLDLDPSKFEGSDRPVEQVSWWEAVEFCFRLNGFVEARLSNKTNRTYRLPSEAEWEYACRAGTTTPFHFGEILTADLANYDGTETYNSSPKGRFRQKTTPVGSFGVANAFGLYDMHGNVWEWCADPWRENYNGAPTDGSAWLSADRSASRVIRGGSWFKEPWSCRSAYRFFNHPHNRDNYTGFRVVCDFA